MAGRLSPVYKKGTGVTVARGDGAYLFDTDGRRYLDFTSGIAVTSTGHCHPKVVAAIRRQAGELLHGQFTTVKHLPMRQLMDRLAEVMPAGLDTFLFGNAGAEAVEAALRLARQATGRANVVVFQGSFHGRTTGALSMTTSKAAYRAGLQPLMGGVFVAPFPYAYRYGWSPHEATAFCLRELDYLFATQSAPEETAAIFVEPILGEGGYVPATPGFLEGLRERCDRHGILLVIDEIQTGVGRTGRFWGHEHTGALPDVLITAKGLASGMPLSAVAASYDLMGKAWPGSQGGTYGGNVVACAAAIATLEVIHEEGLVAHAASLGEHLIQTLRGLQARFPQMGEVRGWGLMVATEFATPEREADPAIVKRVLDHTEAAGLLMLPCGPLGNVIRWMPPLVVTREQIDEGLDIFTEALEKAAL